MAKVEPQLLQALSELWIVRKSQNGLWSEPVFKRLEKVCADLYENGRHSFGSSFALNHALRSLGAPGTLPEVLEAEIGDVSEAAERLDQAFKQTSTRRTYICPLDLAEDVPSLTFGAVRLGRFSAADLETFFDARRLARCYPNQPLDSARLSQFHWLVIEENVPVTRSAGLRAMPDFSTIMDRDFGEIDPHKGRFPQAVETVLFFLLLAPWEKWSTMNEVDWRGFRVPWIYCLDDDLFVSPPAPPSADTLSWEPHTYTDYWGESIEVERPIELRLIDSARGEMLEFSDERWTDFKSALDSELLQPPVMHFVVRAFLANGIDEFMAHLTAIEAALGLQTDHNPKARKLHHPNIGATKRVGVRLASALDDASAADLYADLFNLRSAFIHGRGGIEKISTQKRVSARRLAAMAASALVTQASQSTQTRERVLGELLDKGAQLVAK